jgi:hypothetical protein
MTPPPRRGRFGEAGSLTPRDRSGEPDLLYVYALIDRKLPRVKLHGRTIESVALGGVYAVAQRTERMPPISEDMLRQQYDIIMQLAERVPAILPARFGSLVGEEELQKMVALRGAQLSAAFDLVRGREQMTVRLIGVAEVVDRPARQAAAVAIGPGARYLEERRTAAGYPLPDAAERLTAAVRSMVFAEKAEPGLGGVRAMLYHLIERGRSGPYCRALARAAGNAAPYAVKVTGPFPPFAFAPELLG